MSKENCIKPGKKRGARIVLLVFLAAALTFPGCNAASPPPQSEPITSPLSPEITMRSTPLAIIEKAAGRVLTEEILADPAAYGQYLLDAVNGLGLEDLSNQSFPVTDINGNQVFIQISSETGEPLFYRPGQDGNLEPIGMSYQVNYPTQPVNSLLLTESTLNGPIQTNVAFIPPDNNSVMYLDKALEDPAVRRSFLLLAESFGVPPTSPSGIQNVTITVISFAHPDNTADILRQITGDQRDPAIFNNTSGIYMVRNEGNQAYSTIAGIFPLEIIKVSHATGIPVEVLMGGTLVNEALHAAVIQHILTSGDNRDALMLGLQNNQTRFEALSTLLTVLSLQNDDGAYNRTLSPYYLFLRMEGY